MSQLVFVTKYNWIVRDFKDGKLRELLLLLLLAFISHGYLCRSSLRMYFEKIGEMHARWFSDCVFHKWCRRCYSSCCLLLKMVLRKKKRRVEVLVTSCGPWNSRGPLPILGSFPSGRFLFSRRKKRGNHIYGRLELGRAATGSKSPAPLKDGKHVSVSTTNQSSRGPAETESGRSRGFQCRSFVMDDFEASKIQILVKASTNNLAPNVTRKKNPPHIRSLSKNQDFQHNQLWFRTF